MMSPQSLLILLAAYLFGSIPSALIASRLVLGRDIRELGDGNMGAKNTFHSVGWLAGAAVAAADITKGALAIEIAQRAQASPMVVMLAGACAVLGHDFPAFAGFRGGQGMAAMLGVFGILLPGETIVAVVALGVVLALTRNWDLSCAAAFILLVSLIWVEGGPTPRLLYPFMLLPTLGIRKIMQRWQRRPTTA
jgi:glycerol-3-phosphate acyltransferase PlsY